MSWGAYREIYPTWVEPTIRETVESVVAAASRRLGIDPPRIRWFLPGESTGLDMGTAFRDEDYSLLRATLHGMVRDREAVWIRDGLDVDTAARIAAHEVRHVEQNRRPWRFHGVDEEQDADKWSGDFIKQWKGKR